MSLRRRPRGIRGGVVTAASHITAITIAEALTAIGPGRDHVTAIFRRGNAGDLPGSATGSTTQGTVTTTTTDASRGRNAANLRSATPNTGGRRTEVITGNG